VVTLYIDQLNGLRPIAVATRLSRLVLILLLAGCDRMPDDFQRLLRRHETVITVLAAKPLTISSLPARFEKPLRVVGTMSGVCLSLRGDVTLSSADTMTAEFKSLMGGATVEATATTTDGKAVACYTPTETWWAEGRIEKKNELAACMRSIEGGEKLPIGMSITRMEISSDKPLEVRGVYWESTNAWDRAKLR
jgi:hypothetical protein